MRLFVVLLMVVFALPSYATEAPLYAVITPMPVEGKLIVAEMTHKKTMVKNGITYVFGELHGKQVIYTSTGIGKVNAAVVGSQLINNFHPSVVILLGIAGTVNANLQVGDVVVGRKLYQVEHDFFTPVTSHHEDDVTPINHQVTAKYFSADPILLRTATELENSNTFKVIDGTIATSDYLPDPVFTVAQLKRDHVDAIEMEGAAMAQVCWLYQTRCLVVRSISNDKKSTVESAEDITKFTLPEADKSLAIKNATMVALAVLKRLPS